MVRRNARIALLVVAGIALTFVSARAQKIEVSALGFYQIGGAVDETTQEGGVFDPGQALGINASGGLGLILDYHLGARAVLQITWDQQFSSLRHYVPDSSEGQRTETDISDLKVQYFLIGLVADWSRTKTRPYIGGGIGFARIAPDGGAYEVETRPAFALVIGCKQWISSSLTMQIRGRVAISHMPKGTLFFEEYIHHKETFMPQFQVGVGLGFAR